LETFSRRGIAFLLTGALLGLFGKVRALEIPVENIATPSGSAVGFVDIEKIFQEFPETQRAKAEYMSSIEKKRIALLDKELEIKSIKDRIDSLKKTLEPETGSAATAPAKSTGTVDSSGAPAEGAAAALVLRQQELDEKEKGLETERLKIEQELVDEERHRSQAILGHIYVVLQELAEEAQVSVVVDKSSILYGTAQVDLTAKLRERLRAE
jgi:Skp family chaperone for outer membrane proteins